MNWSDLEKCSLKQSLLLSLLYTDYNYKVINCAAVIFTKNEANNIAECIRSVSECRKIYVIDSNSEDKTVEIAEKFNVSILNFTWNGKFPKKRQWTIDNLIQEKWILFVDADERPSRSFLLEVEALIKKDDCSAAYAILDYFFAGKKLKFGHKMRKIVLMKREDVSYPKIELEGSGFGDVEFHYQPEVKGDVSTLKNRLVHQDLDPFKSWLERHIKYAEVEARLRADSSLFDQLVSNKSKGSKLFYSLGSNSFIFFIYSFIFRLGFFDGRNGFSYALMKSWYYEAIYIMEKNK